MGGRGGPKDNLVHKPNLKKKMTCEEVDKKVTDIETTLFMDGNKALHCSGDDY